MSEFKTEWIENDFVKVTSKSSIDIFKPSLIIAVNQYVDQQGKSNGCNMTLATGVCVFVPDLDAAQVMELRKESYKRMGVDNE